MSRGNVRRGDKLSRREAEVLDLRAQGHTTAEISTILEVAESTVKTWLQNVHAKLGAKNALQAVWEGMRLGIIEPPEREV